jgi:hypothetical protein
VLASTRQIPRAARPSGRATEPFRRATDALHLVRQLLSAAIESMPNARRRFRGYGRVNWRTRRVVLEIGRLILRDASLFGGHRSLFREINRVVRTATRFRHPNSSAISSLRRSCRCAGLARRVGTSRVKAVLE